MKKYYITILLTLAITSGFAWYRTQTISLTALNPDIPSLSESAASAAPIVRVTEVPVSPISWASSTAPEANVSAATSPSTPVASSSATLIADGASYTFPVIENETVEAAMNALRGITDFTYEGHAYPGMGMFIDSIAGKKNGNGYYWFLYINGVSAETGASSVIVHPGDTIEWKYEKSH